jgi:hypothetical protein
MALKWWSVVVDCHDHRAQAKWWADVLDWHVVFEADDEAVIVPKHVTGIPKSEEEWRRLDPALVFVPVPEGKTVKNRLHLDLAPHLSNDRDAMIENLLARGATRVDVGQDQAVNWTCSPIRKATNSVSCPRVAADAGPYGAPQTSQRGLGVSLRVPCREGGRPDGETYRGSCLPRGVAAAT